MRKLFTLVLLSLCFLYGKTQNNCQAWFYPQIVTGSNTVNFNDYSYNTDSTIINVLSWQWSFGDNTNSSTQNPQHTYSGPGTYYVCLVITTPTCTSTYCDSVVITGTSSGCTAYFNSYPDTSCSTCFYFYDGSTGNGLTYSWSFGDNTYSTSQYPYHQYNSIGNYLVCLTISNGSGCLDTYCDSIIIGTTPPGCNAYYYAVPDSFGSSLNYNFYDYSTGNPTSWLWSFGDGSTSTLQYPTHTYQAAGTYTVCLVINTINCVDTFCNVITVAGSQTGCNLYATYSVIPESYSGANNGSIDLTVGGGTAPFTYLWTNNATTEDISNLSEGYYDVYVTDSAGCTTFASVYVPDSSNVYIPIGTLSNLPQDTCLNFNYDTVYVYNVDVIDSFHVAVTWIFLEISSGTTAYLIDTFAITTQGYYTVSITVTCSQKKSSSLTYYGHILVDYNDISLVINDIKSAETSLELFPNPFNESINLRFNSAANNQIKLKLLTVTGKIILQGNYNAVKGLNTYNIKTDKLSHGIYIVNIISGNKVYNKKIVK